MAEYSTDTPRRDVHQQITDQIIAAIEAGAGPAEMPWHRSGVFELSGRLEPQAGRSKTPFKQMVLASIGSQRAGISAAKHEREIH